VLFNSLEFAIFFPTVALLHFSLPPNRRWMLLLVASFVFYMSWKPEYILLLLVSISIDYVAARIMGATSDPRRRRLCLIASLTGNFTILFAFKYYGFIASSLAAALGALGIPFHPPRSSLLLPMGISFYTFQAVSYGIDVYRRELPPERNYGRYALFVTFFPHLVAGPIMRASALMPQIRTFPPFEYERVVDGLRLMVWGLFKKVAVADRAAQVVNFVYQDVGAHQGPALTLATLLFAVQIYGDFSGYSDIARGAARVFGVDLIQNFRAPYVARSIRDFWQRWHISLTTWFRDYVYVPLGGNRVALPRWCFNVMAVFTLSGLWHGANWTFVLWGAFHGACLLASRFTAGLRERAAVASGLGGRPALRRAVGVAFTFLLVNVGWVLFRARTLRDALHVLGTIPFGWAGLASAPFAASGLEHLGVSASEVAVTALLALIVLVLEGDGTIRPTERLAPRPAWVRWPAYYALMLGMLVCGVFDDTPFIYFQF